VDFQEELKLPLSRITEALIRGTLYTKLKEQQKQQQQQQQ
jgi:hypothetical protein